MGNLTNAANVITIINGFFVTRQGFQLLKKENPTEEERKAAIAFKKSFIGSIIVTVIIVIVLICNIVFAAGKSDHVNMYKSYGTVVGNQVKYVQNTVQYKSLSSLGLQNYELQNGDRVIIFFDNTTDVLQDAIPEEIYDAETAQTIIVALVVFVLCIIAAIAYVFIARFTFAKDWTLYVKKLAQEQRNAYNNQNNV